ncbi:CGNR zinc finger domain-containing protein [Nonomuraea endophytica]|uniref:Putative RNA-binding Zn ribbon-like protein n=1 Tax=Nonomuraea endophytica TaxID=714136 RepID=A0A7W8A9Z0_9ACTN|nr:CGNR zinc finger domain-containing protein [Nonomuraea endophytica]MBB5081769.1 putative RNA-binding Zn ribbon-like protein [Nonomuraea endophytica]
MSNDPSNAAPGALEVVRRFVDTHDIYNSHDVLSDVEAAVAWLTAEGLMGKGRPMAARDLSALRDLRGALREMAAANTRGEQPPRAVVDAFNDLTASHAASVRLDVSHGSMVASVQPREDGAGGVVAALAAAVHEAVLTQTWTRLKSCDNPECRWLFYDESRNRTARWCSMRGCGSIVKARRYRDRQRQRAANPL